MHDILTRPRAATRTRNSRVRFESGCRRIVWRRVRGLWAHAAARAASSAGRRTTTSPGACSSSQATSVALQPVGAGCGGGDDDAVVALGRRSARAARGARCGPGRCGRRRGRRRRSRAARSPPAARRPAVHWRGIGASSGSAIGTRREVHGDERGLLDGAIRSAASSARDRELRADVREEDPARRRRDRLVAGGARMSRAIARPASESGDQQQRLDHRGVHCSFRRGRRRSGCRRRAVARSSRSVSGVGEPAQPGARARACRSGRRSCAVRAATRAATSATSSPSSTITVRAEQRSRAGGSASICSRSSVGGLAVEHDQHVELGAEALGGAPGAAHDRAATPAAGVTSASSRSPTACGAARSMQAVLARGR